MITEPNVDSWYVRKSVFRYPYRRSKLLYRNDDIVKYELIRQRLLAEVV